MYFFPVTGKDGRKAYVNIDSIFSLIENGKETIAIATGGATFSILFSLDELMEKIEESETDLED